MRTLGPPLDAVFRKLEFWDLETVHGMTREIFLRVLDILDGAKARWVLVGGTAIAYFDEPRATLDTDLIVESSKMRTVLARLRKAFPESTLQEFEAVIRLKPYDIDFIKSAGHPLYTEAILEREKRGSVYVPPVEIFLALKFLAAKSLRRDRLRRMQDLTDFARVYRRNQKRLRCSKLLAACGRAYENARTDAEALLDAIDHDKPITL